MKFIFIIFLFFVSNATFANEDQDDEVEVINLYESKSLDQMVLENLNEEEDTEEVYENLNENEEIETRQVAVQQIENVENNYIFKNDVKDLENYFNNLQNINSKTLQNQIIEVLQNLELNLEIEKDKQIFFLIVNYLQSIGQINKSYELVKRYEINNDKNLYFFIGGPDGLSKAILGKADQVISLSNLTFPHVLAKVILMEQIYRSICIMNNHPYHRS